MGKLFFFALLLYSFVFSKNVEVLKDSFDLKILTPSLQNRSTTKIKLENGLTVLIVSDPEIKESAAAMAVNAGSWDDPEKYPGMAHFTEHMLFQGTYKYPDRNDFFKFISDCGGSSNAYTSSDKTVYMFSIQSEFLVEGLRHFSQFFIAPLFDPSAISSELLAVDQEHSKNIENDSNRLYQVWKETSNIFHPNHQFATGNSKTLSIIPREELLQWYFKHYKANNMRLVIYSSDPIKKIIDIVSELFSEIPMGEKKELASSLPELSSSLQKGHMIYIKPVQEIQKMIIRWELPKELVNDDTKSAELIALCINSAHKNSLFNVLKKEQLIDEVFASISSIGKHSIFFNLSLSLTDKGLTNRADVLIRCFNLIEHLKKEGIPYFLFDEFNTLSKLKYVYQARIDAFEFIENITEDILDEDLSTYPQKKLFATSYSKANIQKVLDNLSLDLCQVYVLADPQKTAVTPTKKEKWANVEYSIENLPLSIKKSISEADRTQTFSSPIPNPFLPTDLKIVAETIPSEEPIKIFQNDYGVGYFIPTNFNIPEINWSFRVKTPLFDNSSRSYILLDLISKSLSDNLNDTLTQAKFAGLNFSFDIGHEELLLHLKGYSDKAPMLLDVILKRLVHLEHTQEEFENLKKFYQEAYTNSKFQLPVSQAKEELTSLLNKQIPTSQEKLKILNSLTLEDLVAFSSVLFEKAYFECLFTGNQTVKSCESIWQKIQPIISLPYKNHNNKKVLSLSSGPYKITKKTEILGSGVILAIDQNPFSFERMAVQDILAQGIKEPFFSEMRSKQKTAYFVRAWSQEKAKHLFQFFAVQSGTISPSELLYRFEIFIDSFTDQITQNIDQDRFEKIKSTLIYELKKPPQNLEETAIKYSMEAYSYKDFQWIDKKIKALQSLSYEQFLKTARTFLSRENKKRLAILVEGTIPETQNIRYKNISSQDILEFFNYTSAQEITDLDNHLDT